MRRGRPTLALGGGARTDHLFDGKRSLCGKYMWGGGQEVDEDDLEYEQGEICKSCARKAGLDVEGSDDG